MKWFTNLFKKQQRGFQAAQINRLTSDWMTSFLSQDGELRYTLKILRNRSRELGRNNDYVRAFLRSVENNVVGRGIRFQANIKDENGNPNENLNKQIEKLWAAWTKKENCDVQGLLSFPEIERLLIRSVAESGEVLVRFVYKNFGKSKIPVGLQILESDFLDENFNGTNNGNSVRMGIEVDSYGRPIAYHLFTIHPGDTSFPQDIKEAKRIRVDSKDIIHLYLSERPIQSRGIPWLTSAMMTLHQLGGFVDASVIRKRAQASIMGFIQSPEGELVGDVENVDRVKDFKPGMFAKLAPGETVNVPNFGSGSEAEFDPFVTSMIRKTASGVGSSYEEISKDYSKTNYSSSRLALISERDNWRTIQDWLIKNFHQKVYEKFIELAVMNGTLKIPGFYLDQDSFFTARWMPRGWDWVDPLKDVSADKEALAASLRSYTDILADEGKDFQETMLQIKKEKELMKKLGIESDIFSLQKNNQQQKENNSESKKDDEVD